jgi:hypothetical protein
MLVRIRSPLQQTPAHVHSLHFAAHMSRRLSFRQVLAQLSKVFYAESRRLDPGHCGGPAVADGNRRWRVIRNVQAVIGA